MLGILIVLLGGLYACLHLIKRLLHTGFTGKQDPLIRVVNVRSVGIKKQIALVEVPGAVLVIGMSRRPHAAAGQNRGSGHSKPDFIGAGIGRPGSADGFRLMRPESVNDQNTDFPDCHDAYQGYF